RRVPSPLKAMLVTGPVWPTKAGFSWPLATSHSLIVLSALPLAIHLPLRLKITLLTPPVCPLRTDRLCPPPTSQTLTVGPSALASSVPSGLKATPLILPPGGRLFLMVSTSSPLVPSRILITLLRLPL